jgi:tetratricopeptide (TPR) repeat protein/CHAT domain-containing protein
MKRTLLACAAALAVSPILWCQGADLQARLNALRKDFDAAASGNAGGLSRIESGVNEACQSASALPECQKFGLELATKTLQQPQSAGRAASAALLGALRQIQHQQQRSLTELSAEVDFLYGSVQVDLNDFAAGIKSLEDAIAELESLGGSNIDKNVDALIKLAQAYKARAEYTKAEPLLMHALDLLGGQKSQDMKAAVVWNELGEIHEAEADWQKAESYLQRALEIRNKKSGPNSKETGASWGSLGELHANLGDFKAAETEYTRGLAIVDAAAPNSEEAAVARNDLAELYLTLKRYRDSERLYREAWAMFEKIDGENSPETAVCLDSLASLYSEEGAFDKAAEYRKRSLDMDTKIFGLEHPQTAMALNNLGALLDRKGEFREAEKYYRQALAIREKILPPGHPDIAASLNGLGQTLMHQGAYAAAEPLFRRALQILEKSNPPNQVDISLILDSLGVLYQTEGDYRKAEPALRRALGIRESVLAAQPETAASLNNLALLLVAQGAYAEAEKLYERAIRIDEKIYGPVHRDTAAEIINLAYLYEKEDRYADAEPLFEKGAGIFRQLLPANHPDLAIVIGALAHNYASESKWSKAEPLFEEALELQDRVRGPDDPSSAITRGNFAIFYYQRGDYARAEPLFAAALAALQKALGPSNPEAISAQVSYVSDLWALGKKSEALKELDAANRAVTGFWSRSLAFVEENRRQTLARKFDDLLLLSLSAAADLNASDPSSAGTLAALAVSARKGVRSSATEEAFARIKRDGGPEQQRQLQELMANAAQQEISARESGSLGRGELIELQKKEAEIERRLIAGSAAWKEWRTPIEPAQVTSKLSQYSAFIDIMRFPKIDVVTGKAGDVLYAAIIYRPGQGPRFVLLGPAGPIESAVLDLRKNFANIWRPCTGADQCAHSGQLVLIGGERFNDNLSSTQAACALLYNLTMAKLRGAIGSATRLIVSPDAALDEIPWEILRDGDGHYLVEAGFRISYLDSVRSLVYPPAKAEPRSPAAVVADVDYDGKQLPANTAAAIEKFPWDTEEVPAGDSPAGGSWQPLNGGKEILRTLDELERTGKIGVVKKLPLGSEEEVMALAQPAALFAHTHGFFNASPADIAANGEGLNAGIILYGANRAFDPKAPGTDGWLMAKQIMLLNLRGTRLVALMGCETGRGAEAGEGVQGLRHALAVAGARSTLLTLWQVGDLSVARFFGEFLIRSAPDSHRTMVEALADTQLAFVHGDVRESGSTAVSNRWRHPYFWAAATFAGQDGALNLETGKEHAGPRR